MAGAGAGTAGLAQYGSSLVKNIFTSLSISLIIVRRQDVVAVFNSPFINMGKS
jgi:hypothetical protein